MVVRIHRVGELGVAEVHLLTGEARPGTVGTLLDAWRVTLTAAELARLDAAVDAVGPDGAGLFGMPSRDPEEDPDFDGARWVFEGLDDGLHAVVDRFSPEDPELTELGALFLELGRVPLEDDALY